MSHESSDSNPEGFITSCEYNPNISYITYTSELQLPHIISLVESDLSEPYCIYTYRYFIHKWPSLCMLAIDNDKQGAIVGVIICKLDHHRKEYHRMRGYIAMLAIDKAYRKRKIGSTLVKLVVERMRNMKSDEVVLETEVTNQSALGLYGGLGFIRDKRLPQYYLNGVDAFRLKLWFT